MEAKPGKYASRLIRVVFILFAGIFFLNGCSTPAVSKSQEERTTKKFEGPVGQPKATRPQSPPTTSLEAYRKGTLGKETETGPLRDVNFDFDRYDVRPDAREILKKDAEWLKRNLQVSVQIEGHCDERGTNEYNLALGAKRADSVKRFLIHLGIAPARLSSISYGEELPLCKEQSETCWQRNRRAHYVLRTGPTG